MTKGVSTLVELDQDNKLVLNLESESFLNSLP
jgi:hypothetical protein